MSNQETSNRTSGGHGLPRVWKAELPPSPLRAFSLLEVIIAMGILAGGIGGLIGYFATLARSVAHGADATAAANIAGLLRTELRTRVDQEGSLAPVAALLRRPGSTLAGSAANSDPRLDPQLLFASRDGTRIGRYDDPKWNGSDDEKFFEISLMPYKEPPIAPFAEEGAQVMALVYVAFVRWPAFVPDLSIANPRRASPAARDQQQTLCFPGAILR